jgi:hypothetical protein
LREPASLDHRHADIAVECERHRDDRLWGIALRTSGRADVGSSGRDPDGVHNIVDSLRRDAGAVVGDDDLATLNRNLDRDRRRDVMFLGDVRRVIDELFEDDQRPVADRVAGLRDQLPFWAELEKPACGERLPVAARRLATSHGGLPKNLYPIDIGEPLVAGLPS